MAAEALEHGDRNIPSRGEDRQGCCGLGLRAADCRHRRSVGRQLSDCGASGIARKNQCLGIRFLLPVALQGSVADRPDGRACQACRRQHRPDCIANSAGSIAGIAEHVLELAALLQQHSERALPASEPHDRIRQLRHDHAHVLRGLRCIPCTALDLAERGRGRIGTGHHAGRVGAEDDLDLLVCHVLPQCCCAWARCLA
jgi:hypothetical protein